MGETVAVGWERVGERPFDRGHDERDDVDVTVEGEAPTGVEAIRGGSTSISPHDLLPLRRDGEQGGELICMPSPSEEERLLLAMELAVGFM